MLRAASPVGTAKLIASSAVAVPLTGSTNETTLATVTVPAGSMGVSGGFRLCAYFSMTGSTNAKTFKMKFGGTAFNALSVTGTGTVGYGFDLVVRNRGSASSQYSLNGTSGVGSAVSAPVALAIDSSNSQDIVVTGQLGLGTETITLESYEVWLLP